MDLWDERWSALSRGLTAPWQDPLIQAAADQHLRRRPLQAQLVHSSWQDAEKFGIRACLRLAGFAKLREGGVIDRARQLNKKKRKPLQFFSECLNPNCDPYSTISKTINTYSKTTHWVCKTKSTKTHFALSLQFCNTLCKTVGTIHCTALFLRNCKHN